MIMAQSSVECGPLLDRITIEKEPNLGRFPDIHSSLFDGVEENNILTVSGDLLSKPILTTFLVMRPDDGEGDSHADVLSAVYQLTERYNFLLWVVYFEHYFGSCRVCPHRALI
jgi:hypothetical protein